MAEQRLGSLLDFACYARQAGYPMARQFRLEYDRGLYHVTARDNGRILVKSVVA